jgi:hypothetical protein
VGLVLNGTGALVIAEKSVGKVLEVSRESQGLGSGIEASVADAADIFGFGDYEIVHDGWEVPMDCDPVGQKILFQLGHQEQA